jgi:hypothetical protein
MGGIPLMEELVRQRRDELTRDMARSASRARGSGGRPGSGPGRSRQSLRRRVGSMLVTAGIRLAGPGAPVDRQPVSA